MQSSHDNTFFFKYGPHNRLSNAFLKTSLPKCIVRQIRWAILTHNSNQPVAAKFTEGTLIVRNNTHYRSSNITPHLCYLIYTTIYRCIQKKAITQVFCCYPLQHTHLRQENTINAHLVGISATQT